MMIKEEKPIFLKVFLVIVIILIINLFFFSLKLRGKPMTGMTIGDKIYEAYGEISLSSKIFLGAQWLVLLVILMGIFIKDRNLRSKGAEEELDGIDMDSMSEKNGTDLDTLYNILKEKKKMRISNIAKIFKVKKEVAMEWCKILESGNLITFEYISAKEPVARIIEK
jgi:hypothetical protein